MVLFHYNNSMIVIIIIVVMEGINISVLDVTAVGEQLFACGTNHPPPQSSMALPLWL